MPAKWQGQRDCGVGRAFADLYEILAWLTPVGGMPGWARAPKSAAREAK